MWIVRKSWQNLSRCIQVITMIRTFALCQGTASAVPQNNCFRVWLALGSGLRKMLSVSFVARPLVFAADAVRYGI